MCSRQIESARDGKGNDIDGSQLSRSDLSHDTTLTGS